MSQPGWRTAYDPTDPPDGYTAHHAVVLQRGADRALLLCQTGTEVAIVRDVDVSALAPGTVLPVSVCMGRWDALDVDLDTQLRTCWALVGGEWVTGRIEWVPKRRPVLVLPVG